MYKKIWEKIEELTRAEKEMANKQFPQFASYHEGLAVILEELEETAAEQNATAAYWDELKNRVFLDDTEELEEILKGMHKAAVATACEAVQTAAMALKMLDYHGTQMDCPAKEILDSE